MLRRVVFTAPLKAGLRQEIAGADIKWIPSECEVSWWWCAERVLGSFPSTKPEIAHNEFSGWLPEASDGQRYRAEVFHEVVHAVEGLQEAMD